MVQLMNVKDNKKYYERLNIGITMSNMWNSLQTKSEVGLDKSEKGYQQIAKTMAGNIARGFNLDPNLAECLTMCYGSFFPAYGNEGKKVIMQFMRDKGIKMTEGDLARNYVEYDLYNSGNVITPEFDRYLQELFDDSKNAVTPEVQLARLVGQTLSSIKRIEMFSKINQIDLLYAVTKDVENNCINSRRLVQSPRLQKMLQSVPEHNIEISNTTINKIYEDLTTFTKFADGELINGIYEYIGTDER